MSPAAPRACSLWDSGDRDMGTPWNPLQHLRNVPCGIQGHGDTMGTAKVTCWLGPAYGATMDPPWSTDCIGSIHAATTAPPLPHHRSHVGLDPSMGPPQTHQRPIYGPIMDPPWGHGPTRDQQTHICVPTRDSLLLWSHLWGHRGAIDQWWTHRPMATYPPWTHCRPMATTTDPPWAPRPLKPPTLPTGSIADLERTHGHGHGDPRWPQTHS